MSEPTIHGPAGSTYVRSVRLALAEKGAACRLADVAFEALHEEPHRSRHPFGKVPAFEHDGFMLYETQAILRYVDDVFAGPALQPEAPRERARMNQIMGIVDAYAWPSIAGTILWQTLLVPRLGGTPDQSAIATALPRAHLCLAEIERLASDAGWLAANQVTLADLMLAPILDYFLTVPEGADALAPHPRLTAWWGAMQARPAMQRTRPPGLRSDGTASEAPP